MADLLNVNQKRITDANDDPVAGAKLYFYTPGTLTGVTVYQDEALTTPHDRPVLADSAGIVPAIYHNGPVKLNVLDSSDVQVSGYPQDPVSFSTTDTSAAENITVTPTSSMPYSTVQTALEAAFEQTTSIPVTSGTQTAFTVTTGQSLTSAELYKPFWVIFDQTTNSGATLAVDGLAAIPLYILDTALTEVPMPTGGIQAGNHALLKYNGTQLVVLFGHAFNSTAGTASMVKVMREDDFASAHTSWPPSQASTKNYIKSASGLVVARGTITTSGTALTNGAGCSVAANGTGDYRVTFSTAEADTAYEVAVWPMQADRVVYTTEASKTTARFDVFAQNTSFSAAHSDIGFRVTRYT